MGGRYRCCSLPDWSALILEHGADLAVVDQNVRRVQVGVHRATRPSPTR
jgi:hypothetical protein